MKTLTTPVCSLEPQVEAHAAEMFTVLSDPAIYEFERVPPPSVERLAAGFNRLESRRSTDGKELWLNWVVRLPTGELAGYVQATVAEGNTSHIGYEFSSRFWRRGIASASLQALFAELQAEYEVLTLVAVLKAANYRSSALLRKLGFREATADEKSSFEHEEDESVMLFSLQTRNGA